MLGKIHVLYLIHVPWISIINPCKISIYAGYKKSKGTNLVYKDEKKIMTVYFQIQNLNQYRYR